MGAVLPTPNSVTKHGPHRVVVVEDDAVSRSMIATYFAGEGFDAVQAASAAECRTALRQPVDLVLMDIQLPDANGVALAQEIRRRSAAGIIFVTNRDSALDRILGLELVGDDYVTKPVDLRELLARANALLRRRQLDHDAARRNDVLSFGPWQIDLVRRELSAVSGSRIKLTRGEFDLLAALVQARGRPLSRDYLVEVVSNRDGDVGTRTVDALVSRLRRKLKLPSADPVIVTVTDIGYKLGVAVGD
jgi:two-component system torCAD operon response regulator TorR